jgi:hypothetical protein
MVVPAAPGMVVFNGCILCIGQMFQIICHSAGTYVSGYAEFFLRIPSTRHIVLRTCYVVETFSRPLIRSQISDLRSTMTKRRRWQQMNNLEIRYYI